MFGGKGKKNRGQTALAERPAAGAQPEGEGAPQPQVEKVLVFEQRRKKKSVKVIKRVVILAVVLAVLGGCGLLLFNLFAPEKEVVETTNVYRGSISSTVEGSGAAMPKASADITTVAEGKVLQVLAAEGDLVTEGDLLFVVDSSEIQKRLQEAQENQRKAEKNLRDARSALTEIEQSTGKIYEYIEALTLKANATGQIQDLRVKKGDIIGEGTEIATIVNTGRMRLVQYYSYAYEGRIRKGQSVAVSIPSTMANVSGTVAEIEYVRRVTREGGVLFEVTVELDNPGALTEGMTASGAVALGDGTTAQPAESGTLEYAEKTLLKSKSGGEIKQLNVKNFYEVTEGQTILTLDNDEYDKQLDAKKEAVESANESIRAAEEGVETAREAVEKVYETLKEYEVRAPISGTVTQCSIQEGDELKAGSAFAMSIADLSCFTVDMQIDELDIAKLSVGMPADVTMDTYEDGTKYFSGVITSLSMVGKAENGVSFFPGKIEITESEGMMSGYYVNYSITTSQADDVLLVPAAAVQYTEQGPIVFVKDNGQPRPDNYVELDPSIRKEGFFAVLVETGQTGNAQIEIVSGLEEGDEIASGGSGGMDGMMGGMMYG